LKKACDASHSAAALPLGMSFVIPTLNAMPLIERCLQSIRRQDFPDDLLEIVVVDGGSTDTTVSVAEQFGCRILHNPLRLAEPGAALGVSAATHPVKIFFAADNALPGRDWLSRISEVFRVTDARAVYTHIIHAPGDSLFCRYINTLHADPLNWFVFGRKRTDPRLFREVYRRVIEGEGYEVLDLSSSRPLLALAQGFAIRGELIRTADEAQDDMVPVWNLIDHGDRLAYFDAGVYHRTADSFLHFFRKRQRRAVVLLNAGGGFTSRLRELNRGQRARAALWPLYSCSLALPIVATARGLIRDRNRAWLYHPLACLVLTATASQAILKVLLSRGKPSHQPPTP
jgi:glycosyltransferase involved in cell wall biosynthesis